MIKSDDEEDVSQENADNAAVPVYRARLVHSDEKEDGPQEVHNDEVHDDESDDGFGGYGQLFQRIYDAIYAYGGVDKVNGEEVSSDDPLLDEVLYEPGGLNGPPLDPEHREDPNYDPENQEDEAFEEESNIPDLGSMGESEDFDFYGSHDTGDGEDEGELEWNVQDIFVMDDQVGEDGYETSSEYGF